MGLFLCTLLKTKLLRFTLHKEERVTRRKVIEELFATGKTFSAYPLRVFYLLKKRSGSEEELSNAPLQFGVGVSKRYFKKAVDRNRVKRLLRETYRTQKPELLEAVSQKSASLQVFAIFTGKELPLFDDLREKVGSALRRLQKEVGGLQ